MLSAFLSNSRVAVTRLGVLPKVDRIVESALRLNLGTSNGMVRARVRDRPDGPHR